MSSKLREALEEADTVLSALGYDANTPIRTQIKQALAEPLKNCEIGTAEEQIKRWQKFCETQASCEECPYYKCGDMCFARWAQMPYESEVK
jgi:Tfp pilus assembly protein PilV